MNITDHRVLQYVHGVKGGPTRAEFATMHGPVGAILLPKLINAGLLRVVAGSDRLHLTAAGMAALKR